MSTVITEEAYCFIAFLESNVIANEVKQSRMLHIFKWIASSLRSSQRRTSVNTFGNAIDFRLT